MDAKCQAESFLVTKSKFNKCRAVSSMHSIFIPHKISSDQPSRILQWHCLQIVNTGIDQISTIYPQWHEQTMSATVSVSVREDQDCWEIDECFVRFGCFMGFVDNKKKKKNSGLMLKTAFTEIQLSSKDRTIGYIKKRKVMWYDWKFQNSYQ